MQMDLLIGINLITKHVIAIFRVLAIASDVAKPMHGAVIELDAIFRAFFNGHVVIKINVVHIDRESDHFGQITDFGSCEDHIFQSSCRDERKVFYVA